MENAGFGDRSGSSPNLAESNSAKSQPISTDNLESAQGEAVGELAGRNLNYLDALLTMFQSQLSEIKSAGVNVRLFQRKDGVGILLTGISFCQRHQIMHDGTTCPIC